MNNLTITRYDKRAAGDLGQVGVIGGEPNETYHSFKNISKSKLDVFIRRPLIYKGEFVDHTIPHPESQVFAFGQACHDLLLFGNEFYMKHYAVIPQAPKDLPQNKDGSPNRTTKAYKEWAKTFLEPWQEFHRDQTHITWEEDQLARCMRESMEANPDAMRLWSHSLKEVTFRSPNLPLGFRVQCRADMLVLGDREETEEDGIPSYGPGVESCVADLKTVTSLDDFENHYHKFGYYRQAAFYLETIRMVLEWLKHPNPNMFKRFFFVAIEKQPPFESHVFEASGESIAKGTREISEAMLKLSAAMKNNDWPAFRGGRSSMIDLPHWHYKEEEFAEKES